jgi:hypothetical protein
VIARIVIWNLFDSKTTLAEIREHLPTLPDGAHWISNDPEERFGLVAVGDDLPDLGDLAALIGVEPVVFEEYDVE